MTGPSPNRLALALLDTALADADALGVSIDILPGGTRVVDAGIAVRGGLGAGLLLARACMGGLGHVELAPLTIDGEPWDGVSVWTDHPAQACLASQYAGWAINPDGYFAMGSGPLRARARVEKDLFARLPLHDDVDAGVLVLEGRQAPTDQVARWVASRAGLAPEALTLLVAPTASVAGGVQVVARVVETALHKLDALGFDVRRVVSASGTAPLPPVARSDIRAIGRTNDCVLYGGRVRLTVDATDEELGALAPRVPASASADYGTPFLDIFTRYERDFYRIDPLLFSPAEIWLSSLASGRTFHAGVVRADVLRTSLLES
jgi:methenyltetrahydromethanopterin cyclohydrolase